MNPVTPILKRTLAVAAGVVFLLALSAPLTFAAAGAMVSLVISENAAKPVQHGLGKLRGALQAKGASVEETASLQKANGKAVVVAGLASGAGEAARLIAELKLSPPKEPESLLIRRINRGGKTVLLLVGADARGLMYALLDVADRVPWAASAEQPFSEVRDVGEKPFTPERALSIYTFNRAYWESRFYDEAYWARYLDGLAQNWFNSIVVIFGYENGGFLAPCYPYFFDVEGFPGVRMVGITLEQQQRNLATLNRLIQMAHERGVKFTAGIWDHIYRGGVQGGGIPGADEATQKPTPGLVWGVTAENLVPYTKAALAKFVKVVPMLDAIQFRMHDESGLKNNEQEAFWRDVFQNMKTASPGLRLDLRAKGLPDSVIQSALDVGVPFRITTKYWMEQMGLPFHPTHVNKQSQFERYWHFFQVFGRLGYNPNSPSDIWQREFVRRFGKDAAPSVEKALHQASRVLPRIVASCYPYGAFPMTRGWAEKQRLGDLPAYARAEGSDIQQFVNFDEEAQLLLDGGETAKVRPGVNSRWFAQTAAEIAAAVTEAERRTGSPRGKEFDSTATDLNTSS